MKIKKLSLALSVLSLAVARLESAEAPSVLSAPIAGSVSAAGNSFNPVFSDRYLLYISQAHNLVTNDFASPYLGVFVYNTITSNNMLVSVSSAGTGSGNANCHFPSIYGKGCLVAYVSEASNLVGNDTNKASDVFLREGLSGTTRLVSANLSGKSPDIDPYSIPLFVSGNPMIGQEGGVVFFESLATDLVSVPDTNGVTDIFVRDLHANTTALVSVNASGTGAGNRESKLESVSRFYRYAAFTSKATDLVPGATNGTQEVYVRDLDLDQTFWASENAVFGSGSGAFFFAPVLSDYGNFVYFKKTGSGMSGPADLWSYDFETGETLLISTRALANDSVALAVGGYYVAYATVDGIYLWDGLNQSNRFLAFGESPSLSEMGNILLYKTTQTNYSGTSVTPRIYAMELKTGATHLISQRADGSAASFVEFARPALSADGNLVAFESLDDGIVANDLNQASDIFVRDWRAGKTVLVTKAAQPAAGASGMSSLSPNCVSTNGRIMLLTSYDGNLAGGDTNQSQDIFAKDLQTGEVIPITSDQSEAYPEMGAAHDPVLSADGHFAVWTWYNYSNKTEGIYLYDLVNRTNLGLQASVSNSMWALSTSKLSLSADGTWLAFLSANSIYVRNIPAGTNDLVSNNANDPQLTPDGQWLLLRSAGELYAVNLATKQMRIVSYPSLTAWCVSADSRFVFSFGVYPGYGSYGLNKYDLLEGTNQALTFPRGQGYNISVSVDGRWLAYEEMNIYSGLKDVYRYDTKSNGAPVIVSTNQFLGGGGNADWTSPVISSDGRYIAYRSKATNLVDTPVSGMGDIYLWDRLSHTTTLVSVNRFSTAGGNSKSVNPIFSGDGRTLIFQSIASDLVEGDFNEKQDVFVVRLGGGIDVDGDGMDDDWEIANFENLSHDGTADSDGDGLTDMQEFLAGTNPVNGASALRVMTLSIPGNANTTVLWSAVPGRTYTVQYKTNLTQNGWIELPGRVTATGSTGAKVDSGADTETRFYRVVWQP